MTNFNVLIYLDKLLIRQHICHNTKTFHLQLFHSRKPISTIASTIHNVYIIGNLYYESKHLVIKYYNSINTK